ncbi:hypothetical protein BS47DRAFT_1370739 [Hydnum rufescens UP504]|uniref:Oligopeptide transporter n=1 Tax=Hydnum rufescens UP504 TaxID=1448309 RepID=A0A9P6B7Q2_9AGAM|nr:hypothetical protein BS47DRAFT_1370739 [Hydnum rufescens UP504]
MLVNGKPVIQSGADVSNFVVDDRDDGDPALTFRSFFLGTIYIFKPTAVTVSGIFLMLILYTFGNVWAVLLPQRHIFEARGWVRAAKAAHFVNPGAFGLKEHVVATIIASTASGGSSAVNNFAVQKLFYDASVTAATAILATFSTAVFGYGLVGILRPLTVCSSTLSFCVSLHWDMATTSKRIRMFWYSFTGMAIWEIFPAYIFPTLNGISVFCLASVHASPNTRAVFTNIFGGANGNEGLGLGSISLDWQYIGSTYLASVSFSALANDPSLNVTHFMWFAAKNYPMLSTSIFTLNGTRYNQTFVFGPSFRLNDTALQIEGLPQLAGPTVWTYMTACWSIGGLLAHCLLFWRGYVQESFKLARAGKQPDRHWVAMQKYREVPWWWYGLLLVLAFFAGLIVVLKGSTTLPVYGYIIALLLGSFIAPFSNLLFARLGNGIATNQLVRPILGKPVSNLYFSMWSHDVVSTSIGLAGDLKMGQYLKIPPRVLFSAQVWGTIVGACVNYAVMASIVSSQRATLLDPRGTNVWSGADVQSLNSAAVTWSLAGKIYGAHGHYIWRWPVIAGIKVDTIILPVIYMYAGWMSSGVNSIILSSILTGIVSQVWVRRYHPGWYRKYIYVLGGALDGGAQVMIFILSFAVYGASGKARPFPRWWGNPSGNRSWAAMFDGQRKLVKEPMSMCGFPVTARDVFTACVIELCYASTKDTI